VREEASLFTLLCHLMGCHSQQTTQTDVVGQGHPAAALKLRLNQKLLAGRPDTGLECGSIRWQYNKDDIDT
jgi:hypothetical protein